MEELIMNKNDMKSELFQRYNVSKEEYQNMMRKKWLKACIAVVVGMLVLVTVLLFASCEKKDLCYLPHPHGKKICHTSLTLDFDTRWGEDIVTSTYAGGGGEPGGFNTRYILEFWTLNDDNGLDTLVEHREVSDGVMLDGTNSYTVDGISLPAARIAVMCWAEPVNAATRAGNPHFDASDLRQVKLLDCGVAADKDAFAGSDTWDLTQYMYERDGIGLPPHTLTLNRPFGRYRLISNDLKEYFDKQGTAAPLPASARISYQLWIPMTYDVYARTPVNPVARQGFTYTPVRLNDGEMRMAEDVIFVGGGDAEDNYFNFVSACYAPDGALLHESGNVEARIRRNRTTLIYGALLTDRKTNAPGVDDSFDEEIVVVPD